MGGEVRSKQIRSRLFAWSKSCLLHGLNHFELRSSLFVAHDIPGAGLVGLAGQAGLAEK